MNTNIAGHMATKDEERAALKKVKDVIERLGEGSYLAAAFRGCIEVAEDNIRDDAACSVIGRAEAAEKALADMGQNLEESERARNKAIETNRSIAARLDMLVARNEELTKELLAVKEERDGLSRDKAELGGRLGSERILSRKLEELARARKDLIGAMKDAGKAEPAGGDALRARIASLLKEKAALLEKNTELMEEAVSALKGADGQPEKPEE